MSKLYRDINEILEASTIDENLYPYYDLMKEKPNWDKSPRAKKIFQRENYIIYFIKNEYIVQNLNKRFELNYKLKNFSKAKSLVDLCVRKKVPNNPKHWEIEILIRMSDDVKYIEKLKNLKEVFNFELK